jgi:hypothetical protein
MSTLHEHRVEVVRTGFGCRTVSVNAPDRRAAVCQALDEAGNHEYSEHVSEYDVVGETVDGGCWILQEPLSADEISKQRRAHGGRVVGVVRVNIDRIFEGKEVFEGELSRLLIGSDSLSQVNFKVHDHEPGGRLVIQVSGVIA